MSTTALLTSTPPPGWRRALLWAALVALLLVAQSLLIWLTLNHETQRAQEEIEDRVVVLAAELKHRLERDERTLHAMQWGASAASPWTAEAEQLLRRQPALMRIEQRDAQGAFLHAINSPLQPLLDTRRHAMGEAETALACAAALRRSGSAFSRSFFVPLGEGRGSELLDLCVPIQQTGKLAGYLVATYSLPRLLEGLDDAIGRTHEIALVEGDGTRLARAGHVRGGGVYLAERVVDLPGNPLQLQLQSGSRGPALIPNVATALVLGLSIALMAAVMLLGLDVRRRGRAEAALGEALAFRKAMEDSLVTGLSARDLQGRITYVNPAFCELVGYRADELIGCTEPPYWPTELIDSYHAWQDQRMASAGTASREGVETTLQRRNGNRVKVLIFEAPLVDRTGRHTGWMTATMDLSGKQKMEELARQQQEHLQATARLVTVGEMASLLSHELNQPLSAIASYATGSLNLLDDPDRCAAHGDTQAQLRLALQRMAEQAERAGLVIRSVHDFVRRREQVTEAIAADQLLNTVLPLVRLQARKSNTRVEVDLPRPPPRVMCDRTMLEQVLLNLTRNGIQAMENHTPLARRGLTIRIGAPEADRVAFSVIDHGPGITPDVAERLFAPFFTTREQGMGLGLSLCRTVIEQHGGELSFENLQDDEGGVTGAMFSFTLVCADAPGVSKIRRTTPASPFPTFSSPAHIAPGPAPASASIASPGTQAKPVA